MCLSLFSKCVLLNFQQELQELMKGCILLLQAVDSTKEKDVTSAVRKEIRMRIHDVLMTVTGVMDLSIYFRVVTSLLQQQSDRNGTRKVYIITVYNLFWYCSNK